MTQPDLYVASAEKLSAKADKKLWLTAVMILAGLFTPALIAWSFGLLR